MWRVLSTSIFRALFLAALVVAADAMAVPEVILRVTDTRPQTVFSWSRQRCNDEHVPDSPARAFRSADARVYLFASHHNNLPLSGPSLDELTPECASRFRAGMDADPANYDARTWLQAFHTEDRRTVHALGSADYHGSWFDNCHGAPKGNPKCWWSAIVAATSRDGGRHFSIRAPPAHIIARAPMPFTIGSSRPTGFFTSSPIVRKDGHYHAFLYTHGYDGQAAGNCLVRSADLEDAAGWRAWDGNAFSVDLARAGHPGCTVIPGLPGPVRAIVLHSPSGLYIAVGAVRERLRANAVDDADGGSVLRVRFVYVTSRDLFTWSRPVTLMSIDSNVCARPLPAADYPSLLDPDSSDANFGTVGDRAHLYFTHFHLRGACTRSMNRDLVRIPLALSTAP